MISAWYIFARWMLFGLDETGMETLHNDTDINLTADRLDMNCIKVCEIYGLGRAVSQIKHNVAHDEFSDLPVLSL